MTPAERRHEERLRELRGEHRRARDEFDREFRAHGMTQAARELEGRRDAFRRALVILGEPV